MKQIQTETISYKPKGGDRVTITYTFPLYGTLSETVKAYTPGDGREGENIILSIIEDATRTHYKDLAKSLLSAGSTQSEIQGAIDQFGSNIPKVYMKSIAKFEAMVRGVDEYTELIPFVMVLQTRIKELQS